MNPLTYGSVCSGIEAATQAWDPMGWKPAFFSEIEDFPRVVLQYHYPNIPLHGDFTTIEHGQYQPIDLLVGGTPCQSFSIAGLRGGMDDDRGNLALEFLRLADRLRPRWVVWENVPGVLSSCNHNSQEPVPPPEPVDMERNGAEVDTDQIYEAEESHAFECFLAGLSEIGYGWAYRVLDAQYFGVPQRRERVFVVGHLGSWQRAAAVLFERESLRRNSPPRRKKGQRLADTLTVGANQYSGFCGEPVEVAATLNASYGAKWGCNQDIDEGMSNYPIVSTPITTKPYVDNEPQESKLVITYDLAQITSKANGDNPKPGDPVGTLNTSGQKYIAGESAIRRLTPVECERLQGFPDNYTLIPGKWRIRKEQDRVETIAYLMGHGMTIEQAEELADCPDGPRYHAIGNSMAVPVMRWIAERIQKVDTI